ncbi:hypothetical protein CAter282_0260 [Collimonas arenae]|uniref:Uncharacterized protein n=1 Tax=Collimonas arenae TaxID=279058 RepID=A0A127QEN7_9BURK|nr:hypothetical protein CAter10_0275 [Collimonas arenae]AMP08082.1 hypothetical protein CAter282_0260 [Collimonas arenae]
MLAIVNAPNLLSLQQDDFCAVIARAVQAATTRSRELGEHS